MKRKLKEHIPFFGNSSEAVSHPPRECAFVVLATPRCGSTFFCEKMKATGVCGTPREWLQPSRIEERKRQYGLAPDAPVSDVIETVVKRERGPNGVFGIKLMQDTWGHFFVPQRLKEDAFNGMTSFQILSHFFPEPRFVFVRRRNRLKQAVSYIKALQTGLWEFRGGQVDYDEGSLVFDFLRIEEILNKIEQEEQEWRNFLQDVDAPWCEVVFEEFRANCHQEMIRVLRSLNLDSSSVRDPGSVDVRVMADSVNKQWMNRYAKTQEMVDHLERAGSPHPIGLEGLKGRMHCPPHDIKGFRSFSSMTIPSSIEMKQDRIELECGSRFRLPVEVRNTGATAWPAVGRKDGRLWVLVNAYWLNHSMDMEEEVEAGRGALPYDVAPGRSAEVELFITGPDVPGSYTLELRLCRSANEEVEKVKPITCRIPATVRLDSCQQEANRYFGDVTTCAEGWKHSPWYGYYMDFRFPWVYHAAHGWQYCAGKGTSHNDVWLYDSKLEWLWTCESAYPYVWQGSKSTWLYYKPGSSNPRQFLDIEGEKWMSVPSK